MPNGTATFSTSSLTAGTHPITVTYSGNVNFITYTSPTLSQSVLNTTTTSIVTSTSPTVYSEPFTLTVTVTPNLGGLPTPTGTVNVFDATTLIGSGALVGGQYSFTPPALAVGAHSDITAVYATSSYYTSTSLPITQVINQAGSSITISSSSSVNAITGNPTSVYTEPVTFTAQMTPDSPATAIPLGTVTFFDNTGSGPVQIGTASVNASTGLATFLVTPPLAVGTHNITASYTDTTDNNFLGTGTTTTLTQQVNADNTTTTLAALTPSVVGQPVTFQATVAAVLPGVGIPTGTVFFFDDTGSGPVQLTGTGGTINGSGVASFTPANPLPAGANSITAEYGGTTNFNGSTSAAANQQVNAANTTTTLAVGILVSGNLQTTSTVYGQPVTLQATVQPVAPGAGVPSGTVTFYDNLVTGPIATASLNGSGVASVTLSNPLPVGSNSITAVYGATTSYNGSTSAPQTQVVNQSGTTVTVTSSAQLVSGTTYTAVYSQPVTFTATVSPSGAGGGVPTGTVYFYADGSSVPLGSGTLNGSGQATFTTSSLAVNVLGHSIVASYGATTDFSAGFSPAITQEITQDHTNVALSSSTNPSVYSQPVTFTAVVTPAFPGTTIQTGTFVTFKDGTAAIGSGAVNFNSTNNDYEASFTTSTLAPLISHSITASYPTSTNYIGSSSAPVAQVVNTASTTITLSSSTAFNGTEYTSVSGQPVTFTATVSAAPGTGVPAGFVEFFLDGSTTALATVAVGSGGKASYTTSTLTVATHTITAKYLTSNSKEYQASSTAAPLIQQVQQDTVNVNVASSANPSVYGQAVTFTITVTPAAPGGGIPTGTLTQITNQTTGQSLITAPLTLSGGKATLVIPQYVAAITAASESGTTVTITAANGFKAGESVIIAGISPSGYDGTFTVKTATAKQFTYTATSGLGKAAVQSGASAAATNPALAFGINTIFVEYSGSTAFAGNGGTLSQGVFYGTTTTLSSSENPAFQGDTVTFTATVAPAASAPAGSPAANGGIVTFYDGTAMLGTGSVSAGTATLMTSNLALGATRSRRSTAATTATTPRARRRC